MTGHHPPNPLTDQSRWTLAHIRAMTADEIIATAGIPHKDFEKLITHWWSPHTCPMDGHECGTPCCPLAALRHPLSDHGAQPH